MRPDEKDAAYLWDMLDYAKAVQTFISGRSYVDYLKDRMLRGAVERHIEIIGEAARRISESFKDAHPEIPWKIIIGQRNVLAHDYGEIKHERIWAVVTIRIPELISMLEPLIPPLPEEREI
jgi:uncharacterized protein with HEPN domain